METAKATKDPQVAQLQPGALELFDHVSLRYDATIQQGIGPEELEKPAFWAHHALKMRPMQEIRARAEDGTWIAYCIVLDCSRTWAKVQTLSVHRLTTGDVALTQASNEELKAFKEAHVVVFRGARKWSVKRKADNSLLVEDVETKDAAETWLDQHAREQVRPAAAKKAAEPVAT